MGLSVVKDEFWVTGKKSSKASTDGITWRELPAGTPGGRVAVSDSVQGKSVPAMTQMETDCTS